MDREKRREKRKEEEEEEEKRRRSKVWKSMVCMELTKFYMGFVWIVMVLGMDFLLELGCEG